MPRFPRPLAARVALLAVVLAAATGEARADGPRPASVAVFPVENLSGVRAPVDAIRQFVAGRLVDAGVGVVGAEALEAFLVRHRVRYAAGVDAATAALLREELGVDGVVIATVTLSSDLAPPKVALVLRLISTAVTPTLLWADDAGLAGDDAPGLLDLRLVNDYDEVLGRALEHVTGSLLAYVEGGQPRVDVKRATKFRPKIVYNGLRLAPGRVYSIAVLPFFNVSDRRNAGELLALLFMRHLSSFGAFRVVDTGDVRQQLLQARVIMDGGVSVADAELVGTILDADFVLAGRVLAYQDYEGPDGRTRAEFSAVVIERASKRVVWSSHSDNSGTDGVRFFGRGRSTNAHAMATQMVRLATEQLAGGRQ